ncbi:MAG TPA: DUF2252 domain-containing protein [Holophagaceae bacterium]|nr:DUF2252 domain-containing protein [Holophagaceae bacterium]
MTRFEPPASVTARRAEGRDLRDRCHRADQGRFKPPGARPDLSARLKAAVAGRQPAILPLRWARMAESPFRFYRGTAALMAADLHGLPTAGLEVAACGDAHLLNFGAYADPDGGLVFDLNDFDESCSGPFEWDLKRLAASFMLAGREAGQGDGACKDAIHALARAWREALHGFAELPLRELARVEVRPQDGHKPLDPIFEQAARDTPAKLLAKATAPDGTGYSRFLTKLPGLRPLDDGEAALILDAWPSYLASLGPRSRQVAEGYHPYDFAHRAAGCGSLGVRDYLVLCYAAGPGDPLFLEFKSQPGSCWRPTPIGAHRGREVAENVQRLQAWSDPCLGWATLDGAPFLVRQWSDHKASIEVESLSGESLGHYAVLCGRVLAQAQARSGDAARLSGYAGHAEKLDTAMAEFAEVYADQATRDFEAFKAAIARGEFETSSWV